METNKLPKAFDCLKMKEEIQAKIYAEIKDMTTEERIAYFSRPTSIKIGNGKGEYHASPFLMQGVVRRKKELA